MSQSCNEAVEKELENLLEDNDVRFVLCSTVLEELDRHKDCDNGERKWKARRAFKLINNNPDKMIYIVDEVPNQFIAETLFYGFDLKHPDNKILYTCVNFIESHKNNLFFFQLHLLLIH